MKLDFEAVSGTVDHMDTKSVSGRATVPNGASIEIRLYGSDKVLITATVRRGKFTAQLPAIDFEFYARFFGFVEGTDGIRAFIAGTNIELSRAVY